MKRREPALHIHEHRLRDSSLQTRFLEGISVRCSPDVLSETPASLDKAKQGGFTVVRIALCYKDIAGEAAGSYNEAFLASLRKVLKQAEAQGLFAVLAVDAGEAGDEAMIEAVCHLARRVKDCDCVVGVDVTGMQAYRDELITRLRIKHPHYLFFAEKCAGDAGGKDYCLYEGEEAGDAPAVMRLVGVPV